MIMLIPDSSSFSTLVNYFSFAAWLSYLAVFAALIYLRWKRPHAERPYKVIRKLSVVFTTRDFIFNILSKKKFIL